MRPAKSIANQSDRGLALEKLWRSLGKEPPGKVRSLEKPGTEEDGPQSKTVTPRKAKATA